MSLRKLRTFVLPLTLACVAGSFVSPEAQAQDRKEKEERRVLRADDVDDMQNQSDELRAMAREKRHQEMAFAKELLSRGTLKGEQKAEMMLRLADLYFQEGRDIYFLEMKGYEKQFDACFEDESCDSTKLEPDNDESEKWQGKSIKLYRQILDNYPTFARADEATFYLAQALQDTDDAKSALSEYTRLVKTYPESPYVADAYVQIGEYYFDNNNAYKALLAYQKATAFKNSEKYAFALYKLGWCYYNVGEYGKAIDTMKGVVAYSMAADAAGGKQNSIQLQDEALKDLVRFFADAGEMDEAYAYFSKLGKKELIRSMLKRLASTYFEQGKFEESVQTYRRLIAEEPNSADAPEYQAEIIAAYNKIGRKKETLSEIDKLLKTYGKNSAWARANAADPEVISDAQGVIESNLRRVAIDYHSEAKKLGTGRGAKDTYSLAESAYRVYLEQFPDNKHTYEMRYAFGELLYTLKNFNEAYDQYMAVVKLDSKGKRSQFCANSAVFAAGEMVKAEAKAGKIEKASKANKTEAVPLSDWENKKLAALDQYAQLFPADKDTKGMIYEAGYLYYNKNQFKEASDRFRVVIGMDPQSKQAMLAANLILDSFNLVEDWKNLKDVSKAFYDQESLGNKKFKGETYTIYQNASLKLIEVTLEQDSKKQVAAESLVAWYEEFPKAGNADLALNNASAYFYSEGSRRQAMETRLLLLENFPKSKFYNGQVALLGYDYESMADFKAAADQYEKLFVLEKTHENAPDALYSAALFRSAMGDWETAVANYQKYITAYPDRENVQQVQLEIGMLYEKNEQFEKAAKVYQQYFTAKDPQGVSADELMYARLHYGLALTEMGQVSKASKHYEDSIKWFQDAKAAGVEMALGVEFGAQMMFILAQDDFDTYMKMKISGPSGKVSRRQEDKILGDNLLKKVRTLKEIEALYAAIVGTGAGEWGLAALVNLGMAYENFADSMVDSYVPSYLTADQGEFYKMDLEASAYQQEEKAVEAYSVALDKSYELNLYNDKLAFATRRLGELRPEQFPGLEETLMEPNFTSASGKATQSFVDNL